MQIHKLLVSVNQLDRFENGAVLAFDRDVSMLDEGDGLVARLAGGDERLLIVRKAYLDSWMAEYRLDSHTTHLRLQLIDGHNLRVTLEPHHMLMPEAF